MSQSFERSGNFPGSQEGYYAIDGTEEARLKSLAKEVAKKTKKRVSAIKMPFTKEIPYEVERNIEVQEGFFIFKSTKVKKIAEQKFKMAVDYRDVIVDGWLLKTYYETCDIVVNGNRLSQDEAKWFYVLKRDGSLSVFQVGYVISAPKTNSESVRIYKELTEEPMTFDLDGMGLHSAYQLDLKPVKWENSYRYSSNEKRYFRRNYPTSIGKCESKGQSYLIQQPGTGLAKALKKIQYQ